MPSYRKPTRDQKAKPEWPAIRTLYVQTPELTLDQVAEHFGIQPVTVRQRSAREGWTRLRAIANEVRARALARALDENRVRAFETERAEALMELTARIHGSISTRLDAGDLKPSVLDLVTISRHVDEVIPTETRREETGALVLVQQGRSDGSSSTPPTSTPEPSSDKSGNGSANGSGRDSSPSYPRRDSS